MKTEKSESSNEEIGRRRRLLWVMRLQASRSARQEWDWVGAQTVYERRGVMAGMAARSGCRGEVRRAA